MLLFLMNYKVHKHKNLNALFIDGLTVYSRSLLCSFVGCGSMAVFF